MSKRPTKPGNNPGFMPPRPGFAARPTVGLPPSAYGAGPTVQVPGMGQGAGYRMKPAAPSEAEILAALKAAAAHYSARRFREASQILQKILSVQPKNPDALHLTGLLAYEAGKLDDAEKLIRMAIGVVSAPSIDLLVNLGNALRDQGKLDEAVASYDRALAIDARCTSAYLNRGNARKLADEHKEARQDFDRFIEIRPDLPIGYVSAAQVTMQLGLYREALAYCGRAMELIPSPPAIFFIIAADLHERLSEFDAAIANAEKALEAEPGNGEAVRIVARVERRRHPNDKALLAEMRSRLEAVTTNNLPFEHRRSVEEELAQISDRLGDVDAAFEHFRRMNEIAQEEAQATRIDKNSYLKHVEDLIAYATEENFKSWRPLPALSVEAGHRAAPTFIVGFPRSGTTLLDQICDAHPDIQVLEEKPCLRQLRDAVEKIGGSYPQALGPLTEDQRQDLRSVYWKALENEGADIEGKLVIDKLPLSIINAALIARVFPEAKIILALRHPMDSVFSCYMQNFQLNASMANFLTLEDAAHLYDRVMTLWQQYRALLPLNVVEVRYENLIRDLRGEVEPVLDFLGLPWNEAQADPAAHALARGTIRTPSYAQVTQPIYSSAADRWRRYQKHLEPVLPILEKHIRYFGYSL